MSAAQDDYTTLLQGGFSHAEIQAHLGPQLKEAGFADQEVAAYFNRYQQAAPEAAPTTGQPAGQVTPGAQAGGMPTQLMAAHAPTMPPQQAQTEAPGLGDYFMQGLQGSVAGLRIRGAMPDAVPPQAVASADWADRLAMGVGTVLGDTPAMVAGGAAGLLGGPAAPVTVPAGAFGLTEGLRALYMEKIQAGNPQEFFDMTGLSSGLAGAGKGMAVGAVTGGAGQFVGGVATGLGAGALGTTVATAAAEVATMPTAAAALENRLPHPQEFVDAALFIGLLRATGSATGAMTRGAAEVVPKLRDIYTRTGKTPTEVVEAAKTDPTVVQDVLACNRAVPRAFATEVLDKLKAGTEVSTEEVAAYRDTAWAQAVLNERAGADTIKTQLKNMGEKVLLENPSGEKLPWGFIRAEEAAKLSEITGQNIRPGDTHVVDDYAIRHDFKKHGNEKKEALQGQIAITPEDIAKIPEVVREGVPTYAGVTKEGLHAIRYEKPIDGEHIIVVEEVWGKRQQLGFKSMWKRKAADFETPLGLTSETLRVMPPSTHAEFKASGLSKPDNTTAPANVKGETLANTGSPTEIAIDPAKPVMPESPLRVEDSVKLSDVIQQFADALDVPVRTGKMGQAGAGAAGIYKVTPEVIRARVANDMATIAHEAGHHIHKQLMGMDETALKAFESELLPIATIPRAGQSPLPEGFAEFLAKYVVAPEEARAVAPTFFAHFEKLVAEQAPDLARTLATAQQGVARWAAQPAALEVLSHISVGGKKGETLSRVLQENTWDKVYTDLVDRFYPIKKATELLAQGEELPADMNPYTLLRTFQGAKGKATHFIEHSPYKYDTWENVGKPLAETLRAVENMDEFRAYLVARRGMEITGQGKKAGPRPEAMQATVDALGEKYEGLAREIGEYQDHLVNYLVDSGLVDAGTAGAMRAMNQHYVPFFRVMENDGGLLGDGKGLQGKNPIKRLKGSGRDIIDPIESIIKNTYAFVEAAEKNAIGKALADLADRKDGAGWLMEKLPTPKEAVEVANKDVSNAFFNALGEHVDPALREVLQGLVGEEGMHGTATFFRNAQMLDKESQIAVYRKGKREVYQVDPEIAKVMHDLGAEQVPLFVSLLSIPAKTLRAGATLTPDFMVRNLLRDAVDAGMLSRSGFVPGVDSAKGLKSALKHDDRYWNWVKAGGDQATLVSMDRTTLQKDVNTLVETGYADKLWNMAKNPLEALRLVSEISEQTTRIGEFGKATQVHGTDKAGLMQAALESRDLMDFARRGRLVKNFNMMTAFFNAQLQGLDRISRGLKENPKRTLARAAAYITIPSIYLAIKNYGDERIQEIPRAQRDISWVIPVGDALVRLPKPYESGVMFGSFFERTAEFIMDALTEKHGGDINKARAEAYRGFGKSLLDITKPTVTPNFLQPLIEHFANRSTVFDRPIVPAGRENMLPEYQYAPYTLELTKALSRVVGNIPGVDRMNTFSPSVAENYIRAWSGGLGMYAMQALDAAGRKTGALPNPVQPTPTLADTPFVRAFVIRHPSMGAESIQRFRDNFERVNTYLATINGLKKEFKYDDVANLMSYGAFTALEAPNTALGRISKTIYQVTAAPDIPADEKRQLIDSLYFQAITVAREGNRAFEVLDKDVEQLRQRAVGAGR